MKVSYAVFRLTAHSLKSLQRFKGLLHISEIDWTRIKNVEDVLKESDKVRVKLLDVDKAGKMKLSRKVLLPKPEKDGDKQEG